MYLATHNLRKQFGGLVALDGVSVEFHPGSITALVGPNGAGKSTLLNVVAGLVTPDSGKVVIGDPVDVTLTGMAPHEIARRGVGMLFQDVRVFRQMTALDNVAAAAKAHLGEDSLAALFRPRAVRAFEREVRARAFAHLDAVGLRDVSHIWAGQLSYGQQKLVALARLLACDSRILLLDEPTSGIHPDRIDQVLECIETLAGDHGRTMIMIEHNPDVVARVSDRVYRIEAGRVAQGMPEGRRAGRAESEPRPPGTGIFVLRTAL